MSRERDRKILAMVRAECLRAAREACDDAMSRGLCGEGALEAALGAIEMLDLDSLDIEQETD